MFVHIIFKPFVLDQMRIGRIRNNSAGKKKLTEKIISKQCSEVLSNAFLLTYVITIKILRNSRMK